MRCRIAIGTPAVGRVPILRETLIELGRQIRRPDQVIVCGTQAAKIEGAAEAYPGVIVLLSQPGLPRERYAVLLAATDAENPRIVVAAGLMLADGIGGPGLSADEGRAMLRAAGPAEKRCGCPFGRAVTHIARAMTMNLARTGWPELSIDRRGRLRGNLPALRDRGPGRMRPEEVLDRWRRNISAIGTGAARAHAQTDKAAGISGPAVGNHGLVWATRRWAAAAIRR